MDHKQEAVQPQVCVPFPRFWPQYVPNGWEGKMFFRSANFVFVCAQPRLRNDGNGFCPFLDHIRPQDCAQYETFRAWTSYAASPVDSAWTNAMCLANKRAHVGPTRIDFPPYLVRVDDAPFYTKIVERKEFGRQCHLAKKTARDRYFLNVEHQTLYWKYRCGFYAGEERISHKLQNRIIDAMCSKRYSNRHGKDYTSPRPIDEVYASDRAILGKLSVQFQQKVIRRLVRNAHYPKVTQFLIEHNARVYLQKDRRSQCARFFDKTVAFPNPLVRIILLFVGYI